MSDNNIPNVDNVIPLIETVISTEVKEIKIPTTAKEFINNIDEFLPENYWFSPTDQKIYLSTGKKDLVISSPFAVIARTQNPDRVGGGVLLGFIDMDGEFRKIAVPRAMAAGDFKNLAELLLNQEMPYISTGSIERRMMMESLLLSNPSKVIKFVSKTGWIEHDYSFALHKNIINGDGSVVYQTMNTKSSPQRISGTLDSWHEAIGKYCVGNPTLMVAAAASVSSCLAELLGCGGFLVGIYAPSSTGKTLSSGVYSTIIGYGMNSWKTTDNAAESLLEARNGIGVVYDDMSEASPSAVALLPYQIGNGEGKSRADITGAAREAKTFTVIGLSTAEKSANEFMNETVKKDSMGGVDVRFIQGKSDVFKYKCFDNIHEFDNASQFATHLKNVCKTESKKFNADNCGIVLNHFIKSLSDELRENNKLKDTLRERISFFSKRLTSKLPDNASPQISRVAEKYALLLTAGEYACNSGAFKFDFEEMKRGLWSWWNKCYLESRGGVDQKEDLGILTKFIDFISLKHNKHFSKVDSGNGFQPEKTNGDLYGYYDQKAERFYVTPSGMKTICGTAANVKLVCSELVKKEMLESGVENDKKVNYIQKKIGKLKNSKYFSISDNILNE